MSQRALFGDVAHRVAGAPPYRGRPMALREHILEKSSLLDVREDTPDRLVVRWRLFSTTQIWERVDGSLWFEQVNP